MQHLGEKQIWIAHHNEYVGIDYCELDGVTYYFVDNERYFKRMYSFIQEVNRKN